jgi:hypothetical protein
VDSVTVAVGGMELSLRHGAMFGMNTNVTSNGSVTALLTGTHLGDGQGIRRSGVLLPRLEEPAGVAAETLRAAALCPVLAATPWRDSGAYGPFGLVPGPPSWLAGDAMRQAFGTRHTRFVDSSTTPRGPFANLPFGLARTPGQTGGQADFGVLKLAPVAATGLPSFLFEVEPSVLQEACRPVHFFEADATRECTRKARRRDPGRGWRWHLRAGSAWTGPPSEC